MQPMHNLWFQVELKCLVSKKSWSQMSLHIYCTLFDIDPGKLSVEVEYRIPKLVRNPSD